MSKEKAAQVLQHQDGGEQTRLEGFDELPEGRARDVNEPLYTVRAIDGDIFEFVEDVTTESLRYERLKWSEAVELCRLSFMQGFRCVIWQTESGEDAAGGADNVEKSE